MRSLPNNDQVHHFRIIFYSETSFKNYYIDPALQLKVWRHQIVERERDL